jgi:diadenosine tetraphosphate (Ap4A) HIT family hydrolase
MGLATCPLCTADPEEAWIIHPGAVAVPHSNPLTNCHMVVAPSRHVPTFYDLDVQEQRAVWDLVGEIQTRIGAALKVEGFHVGFADSSPTHPFHAHIHVIPRTPGDCVVLSSDVDWVRD